VFVGKGHTRIDDLAGGENGACLLGGRFEGQMGQCGWGSVRGEGAEVEVGGAAEDLGEDEVVY
jgi:hypothetical protein